MSEVRCSHLLLGDVEDDGRGLEEADGGGEGVGPIVQVMHIKGAHSVRYARQRSP